MYTKTIYNKNKYLNISLIAVILHILIRTTITTTTTSSYSFKTSSLNSNVTNINVNNSINTIATNKNNNNNNKNNKKFVFNSLNIFNLFLNKPLNTKLLSSERNFLTRKLSKRYYHSSNQTDLEDDHSQNYLYNNKSSYDNLIQENNDHIIDVYNHLGYRDNTNTITNNNNDADINSLSITNFNEIIFQSSKSNNLATFNSNQTKESSLSYVGESFCKLFWGRCLILSFIMGLIILCTIIGNAFVIAAVVLEKNLHNVANYLILSLAVADLMVAVMVMPIAAYQEVSNIWNLGNLVCDMWTSFDVLCCTASILHLVAIALDRYWAITKIDYGAKRTSRRIFTMIAIIWIVSGIISILPHVFGLSYINLNGGTPRCQLTDHFVYQLFSTLGAFYLPLIVMCIIYWKIFQSAKFRIRKKAFNRPNLNVVPMKKVNTNNSLNQQTSISNHFVSESSKANIANSEKLSLNVSKGDDINSIISIVSDNNNVNTNECSVVSTAINNFTNKQQILNKANSFKTNKTVSFETDSVLQVHEDEITKKFEITTTNSASPTARNIINKNKNMVYKNTFVMRELISLNKNRVNNESIDSNNYFEFFQNNNEQFIGNELSNSNNNNSNNDVESNEDPYSLNDNISNNINIEMQNNEIITITNTCSNSLQANLNHLIIHEVHEHENEEANGNENESNDENCYEEMLKNYNQEKSDSIVECATPAHNRGDDASIIKRNADQTKDLFIDTHDSLVEYTETTAFQDNIGLYRVPIAAPETDLISCSTITFDTLSVSSPEKRSINDFNEAGSSTNLRRFRKKFYRSNNSSYSEYTLKKDLITNNANMNNNQISYSSKKLLPSSKSANCDLANKINVKTSFSFKNKPDLLGSATKDNNNNNSTLINVNSINNNIKRKFSSLNNFKTTQNGNIINSNTKIKVNMNNSTSINSFNYSNKQNHIEEQPLMLKHNQTNGIHHKLNHPVLPVSITTNSLNAIITMPSPTLSVKSPLNSSTKSENTPKILKQGGKKRNKIDIKRERKAAKTLGIIMSCFILCWLPFFTMQIIFSTCKDCSIALSDNPLVTILTWLGYLNSSLNPILYTIFSPDFREAFAKILFGKYNKKKNRCFIKTH